MNTAKPLELWGGHECSVIRVHEEYRDQTILTGHQHRPGDLERFAELGLKALRYPVLWERVSPEVPTERDFTWSDERLSEIRRLGMRPIVGLIHHGSGPRYTSLVDDSFAPGLAAHARAVAERYPWVEDWSPVNEPLTTARFSCLYGAWYPHGSRDEGMFWTALLNQVNAVRLAMREIRRVNPDARLIQTEDLGFTHATPPMAGQAAFENDRRWATWDLLAGRVTPGHPLRERIAKHGLDDRLRELADDPCPANLLGANYYTGSERFLDHRVEAYPHGPRGQDGPGDYANTDAVRSLAKGALGLAALLDQAWQRYRTPLAVTEAHVGGTRDELMRWVWETWRIGETLRRDGIPVEAVTPWALLGALDWKILGVEDRRRYELGAFDLTGGGELRPTAVAALLQALAAGREVPANVALAGAGWWRRDVRFTHDTDGRLAREVDDVIDPGPHRPSPPPPLLPSPPILITGKTGMLGRAFVAACERRALPCVATGRAELRLEDPDSIEETLKRLRPCAVINAAGWSDVEGAEAHVKRCLAANAHGPENLARACKLHGISLVTLSCDLVFDGTKGAPYVETDEPRPLNAYGRSKAEGERRVFAAGGRNLVVRSGRLFSCDAPRNFAVRLLNALADGRPVVEANDCFGSPTYAADLVDATLDLLIDGETGIWHVAQPGRLSGAEFARTLAERAGLDPAAVQAVPAEQVGWRAPRPRDVTLASVRGNLLSETLPAIDRFLADTRIAAKRQTPHSPIRSP